MSILVGLHGRTNGRLVQADLDSARTARLESYKLMSTAAYTDVDSLRAINPSIFIMVRLFADFTNRVITPELFVSSVIDDLNGFYAKGVSMAEIHNEPNLTTEGLGLSWTDGASFAAWWTSVFSLLKAVHPDLLLGWPGISPGGKTDARMDENIFLDGAGFIPRNADFIGCHCYWQQPGQAFDRQGGGNYLNYQDRYPGKDIYITEFSMTDPTVPSADKGHSYVQYYQGLSGVKAAFSFVSSSPNDGQGHATFPGQVWANEDGSLTEIPAIVGARSAMTTEFARGIDVSGDNQLPSKMHFDQWATLGFCYGWVEWTNGTRLIPHAAEHRQLMLSSNYLTGGYANLRADDKSPEEQCDVFLNNCPWDGFLDMLDVELRSLTEPIVRRWINRWLSKKSQRALVIYTGKGAWEFIVPDSARSFYSDQFEVVVGSYPFDSPPTWDPITKTFKDIQPMDAASVARRSNPPPGYTPPLPLNWTVDKLFSHQHSGHGSLPGYDSFLDLHVSRMTQAQLRARFSGSAPIPIPTPASIQDRAHAAQGHDNSILDLLK